MNNLKLWWKWARQDPYFAANTTAVVMLNALLMLLAFLAITAILR